MERRLKLLASQGVRNIDQYNRKVRQLQAKPRSLFEEEGAEEELEQIPYVLIIIDELADLMMLERANVEESVTRLAQMARAVGMHLVLATQRPSVDVITGLIKANFPSRISFRVATRVDSRTVLDVMGAEHLLGKGDMLFLPPGSSRLVRVHGSYVSGSGKPIRWSSSGSGRPSPNTIRRSFWLRRPTRKRPETRSSRARRRPGVPGCRACGPRHGQSIDVHPETETQSGLRTRRAHSRHDAAGGHYRPARRQPSTGRFEAAGLA